MEKILNSYYENEAKKLHSVVDRILKKLQFVDVDKEDFYSLANEIFVDVIKRYDGNRDFDGFLYSCLTNKFKTEMTRRNRQKRKVIIEIKEEDENGNIKVVKKGFSELSLDSPIRDDNSTTLGDMLAQTIRATDFDIDKTFFEDNGERYSEKMIKYINRLSNLQKEVVKLIIAGYIAEEIKQVLNIDEKQYQDCMMAIRSYKNVSILF